jgi:cytochrome P450
MDTATVDRRPEPLFDSFAAELIENPYPHYDRLRASEPVYWDPVLKLWVLTQYQDILDVLKNDSFEVGSLSEMIAEFGRRARKDYAPLIRTAEWLLFFTNGERHKLGRRTLSRLLTHIPLTRLRPIVQEIVKSLVESVSSKHEFDAVSDYAELLTAGVMARILGLPAEDAPVFLELARDFPRLLDIVPPSFYDRLNPKAGVAIHRLAQRITDPIPGGDRAGLLLIYDASDSEDKVADAAALAFSLFIVGTETTSSLTASCIDVLLQYPELYRRARENPVLASRIVSEVLRLESPVQRGFRKARKDQLIGGKTIRQGDGLLLLFGAGNRDPSIFVRPAELDLERQSRDNLAFGAGTHTCLGKALAKLETEVALEQFLGMSQLVRAGPSERWRLGKTIRRFSRLPVRFQRCCDE